MATTIQSAMPMGQEADAMDIDIDMEVDDNGPAIDDEFQLEEGEEPSFVPSTAFNTLDTSNVIPAIYTEDPALEPQWSKIHVRGVDEFHTNDILAFSHDNFPSASEEPHIQWIDDTSANIVFKTPQMAHEALLSFISKPTTSEAIQNAPFELRAAKSLASRPASMLTVRVAQAGDRKRKGARDASRYYLLNPSQDPTERMRQEFANSRTGRSENGDYRKRRFDDREYRRRQDQDHNAEGTDFAASMYDDAPATEPENSGRGRDLSSRITRMRRRSASPGRLNANSDEINVSDSDDDGRNRRQRNGYRDRTDNPPPYRRKDPAPFPKVNAGKELFGEDITSQPVRQAGGLHSDRLELFPSPSLTNQPRPAPVVDTRANAAAARRLKADLLSATQTSPRSNHRRSHAMDAKNEEDLAERFARKSISIDSTKSMQNGKTGVELFPSSSSGGGFSIRGSADNQNQGFSIKGSGGLSIKGRAEVKELFPSQYSGNQGKELFDEPVRQKNIRRRAGDLFD